MAWFTSVSTAYDAMSLDEVFNSQQDIILGITNKLQSYIDTTSCKEEYKARCKVLLDLAIACIKIFMMENWTGPCLDEKDMPNFMKAICSEKFENEVMKEFCINNDEGIHRLSRKPGFFYISYVILIKTPAVVLSQVAKLWKLRCLMVYQNIVEESCDFIYDEFLSVVKEVEADDVGLNSERETRAQFHLECAHMHLKYYGYKEAKCQLDKVGDILGIDVKLSGAPGKRTKYQEKELAQLRIEIKMSDWREDITVRRNENQIKNLPTDILLDDDTLLPQIKFSKDEEIVYLKPIEQAYILSLCMLYQKSRPKDNLLAEEMLPYVNIVLQDPQVWSIQAKALHLRSLLESQKRRTVERSMIQMERLNEEYRKGTAQDESKLDMLQSVDLSPRWINEACFGRILVLLGCTKAALEIFERIEAWDDVIDCYQKLGRLEKAENIIRREIEKAETAKLWCLLGDVTMNIEHYEKAWEMSKHRNARSQRSLGFHYLRSGKLEECIPCFQASLGVNSLQPQIWFSLGCASMATGQLELAQTALQRFVSIEPDSYEAWTNLANVFIKTQQKQRAFKALKEALKANHGSWQVWENYLFVTVDIGEFKEAIRSFHGLLDLKRKQLDAEVLRILVGAVINGTPDAYGVSASSLKTKLLELFGRICSQITNNAEVFLLYGDLCFDGGQKEEKEKAFQNYLKAHRSTIQNAGWEQDQSNLKVALEIFNKLLNVTFDLISPEGLEGRDVQIASSTKMAVDSFLKRFDLVFPEGLPRDSEQETVGSLQNIRENYARISKILIRTLLCAMRRDGNRELIKNHLRYEFYVTVGDHEASLIVNIDSASRELVKA